MKLTDDQLMIRDSAAEFLADACDSASVRKAAGFDPLLWDKIGELGWCGTAIAEAHGGLGMGPAELCLIAEQMGRVLAPVPFFSSVCLAGTLLNQVGNARARKDWLPKIADGSLIATACMDAELRVNAGKLSGTAIVSYAREAGLLLFCDGRRVYAVPPKARGLKIEPLKNWDETRRFARVTLRGTPALRVDDGKPAGLARARLLSLLYLSAEQLGGAQRCLDLTLQYTSDRKQFGRAIASFQAVKHRCAQLMVMVESLRSLVHGASLQGAGMECAAAKAQASEVFFHAAAEAIQLHGGVGFTTEFDPQLYFKRAQASSHWLGATELLREAITDQVVAPQRGSRRPPAVGAGEFRREVADWMAKHLTGRFAVLKHRGGPGDEEAHPALRKDWERVMAKGRWTCVGWPKPWGRGLSIEDQVIFHEEYARAGGPGRISLLSEGLLGPALLGFGSEEQKQRHLPGIVAGTTYWAQGYSEPNAGSDLSNVQTRCEQQPDGSWRVTGQKIWTSLAHESEWIFVLARGEPGSKGGRGLNFLLMPLKQKGITIRPIEQMSGGSEFNEVFFDGAVAAADDVVGGVGNGWKVAMGLLEAERGVSTLGQQMRFAYELELVVKAAKRNGKLGDALIRQRLAQAWTGLRVLRYNALRMLGDGASTQLSREALISKYCWSNWHRDLGKLAADVLGPEADVISEHPDIRPLQQLFLFSRADTIYAGTNEIQLNLIAERGLGMPREPRGDK